MKRLQQHVSISAGDGKSSANQRREFIQVQTNAEEYTRVQTGANIQNGVEQDRLFNVFMHMEAVSM